MYLFFHNLENDQIKKKRYENGKKAVRKFNVFWKLYSENVSSNFTSKEVSRPTNSTKGMYLLFNNLENDQIKKSGTKMEKKRYENSTFFENFTQKT